MQFMRFSRLLAAVAVTASVALFAKTANPPGKRNVLGLQSHYMHPTDDFPHIDKEMQAMRDIGVSFYRSDIDWSKIEKQPGVYDFSRLDATIAKGMEYGLEPLVVVIGSWNSIPEWHRPLSEHTAEMQKFLKTVAQRYAGRIKYWEIGNEQDQAGKPVGLWETNQRPDIYMKILIPASETLRKYSPNAVLSMGGLTSPGGQFIPYEYLEKLLQMGLKKYVDIIAIHPYPLENDPEDIYPVGFQQLRELLKRYDADDMPIWGTETGECQGPVTDRNAAFKAAFEAAGIKQGDKILAVMHDDEWRIYGENRRVNRTKLGAPFKQVIRVTLNDVKKLDSRHVLLWTSNGESPISAVNILRDFLKRNGTIVFPQGLPLYCVATKRKDGLGLSFKDCSDKYMPQLHIGWTSYWKDEGKAKGVPMNLDKLRGPGFDGMVINGRILTTTNLQGNDQFIPVAFTDNCKSGPEPILGVYKLDSDLKGTVIFSTQYQRCAWNTTQEEYGRQVSRQMILLRALGEEATFIYKLRKYKHQKFYTYGIVAPDMTYEQAAKALKTQCTLMPEDATLTLVHQGDPWIVKSVRPNGEMMWAIWNQFDESEVNIAKTFGLKSVKRVISNQGEPLPIPQNGVLKVKDELTYIQ